jgi:hypothetical protein
MRRLGPFLAAFVLAGCAGGADASRAQELLLQAEAAQARLSSVAYTGRTSFSVAGQRFGFDFGGEAVLKGAAAGDQWMQLRSESVPGLGSLDMSVVKRGSRVTFRSQGQTQELPVPAGLETSDGPWGSLGTTELSSCVERVDVAEGRNVNGEPATRIAGVVDTACAFQAVNRVASLGQAGADLDELREHVGDARATFFVSDRSQLLIAGVISLEMEAEDQKMTFEVSYRLTGINEPVRFP